jgi:hypothetical protein
MAHVTFVVDSGVPAASVRAAAIDFSPDRPARWPTIDREVYKVHGIGETWAEVTEGSRFLGGIWARERYDWSDPEVVRATVLDSNAFEPGGTWELRATERDGTTQVAIRSHRRARGLRGRVLGAMLSVAGRSILASNLARTLDALPDPSLVPATRT